jgi:hypothetical protein
MRRAAKRDDSEREIVEVFQSAGASVRRISLPGAPDLLVGGLPYGTTRLVECKSRTGRLRESQLAWQAGWHGSEIYIARSAEDAAHLVRMWLPQGRAKLTLATERKHDGGW